MKTSGNRGGQSGRNIFLTGQSRFMSLRSGYWAVGSDQLGSTPIDDTITSRDSPISKQYIGDYSNWAHMNYSPKQIQINQIRYPFK